MPSQFNPPSGSRLLAFASRTPSATTTTTVSPDQSSAFPMSESNLDTPPPQQPLVNGPHRGLDMVTLNVDTTDCSATATGLPPGFPNPINTTRQSAFPSDSSAHVQSEILRRQSLVSFGDRMTYGASPDLNAYSEIGPTNPLGPLSNIPNSQSPSFDSGSRERGHGGSPFPQQKGSRFAKFFDGKSREQPATPSAEDLGSLTHPLLTYQRQQNVGGGESYTHNTENRTMEDIFAMLQNSTQVSYLVQVFAQCPMFIRDSASLKLVPTPNLPGMARRLLFNSTRICRLRDSLSWPPLRGVMSMTSCMTTAWTIVTLFLMEWSRACVRLSRPDERVECFKTLLTSSVHSMSSSIFHPSELWTRCILLLSLLYTTTRLACRGTQVSRCSNHFVMVIRPILQTFMHPHNNDCRPVWRTLEDGLHTILPSSWAR
jgi:hypothetical protein